MILDCYIIREYLPNGKHTDHGYYERQEMLDDAKECGGVMLPYMGSSNQRVIDTWQSLMVKHKPTLWWTPEEKGK